MRPHPYENAPRLPLADGPIDVRSLFAERDEGQKPSTGGAEPRDIGSVEVEIGPGRGGFLLERLAALPQVYLLGFEIRRKWAQIVDERLVREGYGARARVFAEDARHALERLGPDGSVSAFFLNFPDPWWKKRHQKRLVLQPGLIDCVARLLVPGGELFVQTDVEERAAAYESLLASDARFTAAGDPPKSGNADSPAPGSSRSARLSENPYLATSHRERRARADGIPIFRLRFRRSTAPWRPTRAAASDEASAEPELRG